jgi:hypothetical protein
MNQCNKVKKMQINKWEKDKNTTIPSVDVVGIIVNVEHEE